MVVADSGRMAPFEYGRSGERQIYAKDSNEGWCRSRRVIFFTRSEPGEKLRFGATKITERAVVRDSLSGQGP